MDHSEAYPAGYIAGILSEVKTVAMVGASPKATRASHDVLGFMHAYGYNMIPVNPREAGNEIQGLKVVGSLADIAEPVDMVQVFRSSDALLGVAQEAIAINAKVLWTQLGVYNEEAAKLAEEAGLQVVMDRCPKIELV